MGKFDRSKLPRWIQIAGLVSIIVLLLTPRPLAVVVDVYRWPALAGVILVAPILPMAWVEGRQKGVLNGMHETFATLIFGVLAFVGLAGAGNAILALGNRTVVELPVLSADIEEGTTRRGRPYKNYYIQTLDLEQPGESRSFDVGGPFNMAGSFYGFTVGQCLALTRGDGPVGWPVIFDLSPRLCSPERGVSGTSKEPTAAFPRYGPVTAWHWRPKRQPAQDETKDW